jgi:hypothetical protein
VVKVHLHKSNDKSRHEWNLGYIGFEQRKLDIKQYVTALKGAGNLSSFFSSRALLHPPYVQPCLTNLHRTPLPYPDFQKSSTCVSCTRIQNAWGIVPLTSRTGVGSRCNRTWFCRSVKFLPIRRPSLVRFLLSLRRHLPWPCRRGHFSVVHVVARPSACTLAPGYPAWSRYARFLQRKSPSHWCGDAASVAVGVGVSPRHGQRMRVAMPAHGASWPWHTGLCSTD